MTRIFFDCEFTGLRQDTTLISIGIASDCNKTFYAEFNDYNPLLIDSWIEENVIKRLRFSPPAQGQQEYFMARRASDNLSGNDIYRGYSVDLRGSTEQIKNELIRWLAQFEAVEVWGDCLAYDWVLFCQIFGHAFNLPKNVYYIPFDLSTLLKTSGIDPDINRENFARQGAHWFPENIIQKHNALWDALVIRACVEIIYDKSSVIHVARLAFSQAFKEDPDFRRVYADNIACVLMDEYKPFAGHKAARDDLADKIIKRIFED